MKRRIIDMVIGQVIMAVMLILAGIAYEGIGYSDFSDIAPYIQLAMILLGISVIPSVTLFYTAINGFEYLKAKKELNKGQEVEQA
jgi:hypothetical protein